MEGPIEFRIMLMSIQSGRKHPAKLNADTLNATRNAKSPAHRTLRIAHGRARTVDAVRCPAPSLVIFFHVPNDAGRRSAAVISVYRYVVKSVLLLNIVRSALPKIYIIFPELGVRNCRFGVEKGVELL